MVNIVRAAVDHPDADSPLRWSLEVEVDSSVCRNFLTVELNLVLSSSQALTRFSISRKSQEEMVHFFLSRAGELNVLFSRCSRLSRF